ncbi:bifunctional transcriptional activator/DNA repair enzyme AdaA [Paenibacillus sp. OV219]|uniref:bifunctional transcriptional activator/DNA repair enzyme AdaA n=1 Tax=Paenibacillus sp. OV219 TaxID=1884377 RepID=UPI0008B8E2A3|nr:Ada metal-binding domain-containing protein [Paenibacillus sp. OV219]SEM88009.1 AraC family transcriptional regulator, regulatory protein of adaptative response / methylphosphotriester-DNA alkyltransferase methyltransferase [Paenibacillus sp. OV219]
MMTDERWNAIVNCDAAYDGQFYYGVTTTGIFCRPSCKSRSPLPGHVRLFESAADALADRFRPCKRCKPDGMRLPDEEWAAAIKEVIEARYQEPLTLPVLAELMHVSPYHMHRTFKRMTGESPAARLSRTRITAAKQLLRTSALPVREIAAQVGFPNAAHFATVFQKAEGCSPTAYRQQQ